MTRSGTTRQRPTRGGATILAALAVLVGVSPIRTVRPAGGGEFTVPPPSHDERVEVQPNSAEAGTTEAGRHLYRLPESYHGPLGTLNQTALVAHQKKRLGVINEKLGVRLRMSETRHYLVFSDVDSAIATRFRNWSEALYGNLLKHFGLSERARVWDGKCVVILFARRRPFEQYAKVFDGNDASRAGAYFAVEYHGPGRPNLVHMCFPADSRDVRHQQELFAHEGTHAFFELYKTPGRLPLWLHEGLAEYMTTVNDRALRAAKWPPAVRVAAAKKPISGLFTAKAGESLSVEQYRVALTLVDFLLEQGRPKFKAFVDALKDGKEQEAALQQAYGFGLAELARRWRGHVGSHPPGHGHPSARPCTKADLTTHEVAGRQHRWHA